MSISTSISICLYIYLQVLKCSLTVLNTSSLQPSGPILTSFDSCKTQFSIKLAPACLFFLASSLSSLVHTLKHKKEVDKVGLKQNGRSLPETESGQVFNQGIWYKSQL